MRNVATYLTGCTLIGLSAALLVLPQFAAAPPQQSMTGMDHSASAPTEPVPAFHAQPPSGELPPTMEPSIYTDKLIFNAYAVAARVKKVLYQQPCYCHCDRSHGHGSLLDCFVGRHGSECDICIKEVFYSYEQTRRGKTPAEIREGIIRGDWQKVELAKYQKDYLPPVNAPVK
ncbi:MAG TPA: CYCXC family (seleno)protein [Candidatus Sulfotelmatobacter sp.]|nr:CYCXC family (seleno)protein [Candidatus Sulfotelmatobacter sp.]